MKISKLKTSIFQPYELKIQITNPDDHILMAELTHAWARHGIVNNVVPYLEKEKRERLFKILEAIHDKITDKNTDLINL